MIHANTGSTNFLMFILSLSPGLTVSSDPAMFSDLAISSEFNNVFQANSKESTFLFDKTYYTTRLIAPYCYKHYNNTYNPCVLKNDEVLIKKQLVYYILSIFPGLPE